MYRLLLLIAAASLYTSRLVLNTLGVEDFGNFIFMAGLVPMLAFLNGPMVTSTRSDLTTEQEIGNIEPKGQLDCRSACLRI